MFFLLRADNNGEGGVLSLRALAQRAVGRSNVFVLIFGLCGAALFWARFRFCLGPVTTEWFFALAAAGMYHIGANPAVLAALAASLEKKSPHRVPGTEVFLT